MPQSPAPENKQSGRGERGSGKPVSAAQGACRGWRTDGSVHAEIPRSSVDYLADIPVAPSTRAPVPRGRSLRVD